MERMSPSNIEVRRSVRCPVTGSEGQRLRCREGAELAASYRRHFGHALPTGIVETYFQDEIQEYTSPESDLRWFSPAPIAGEEFYQLMAATYPWYYTASTWDKHYACRILRDLGVRTFIEAGCGDGIFLEMAAAIGVSGKGIDTNTKALETATAKGLIVGLPDSPKVRLKNPDALVMLQVLEHVPEPLEFVRHYVTEFQPKRLIIAVPSHETLLAHVTDPLAWPPHHVTMWSRKAFECLGAKLGYSLNHVAYPPMTYQRLVQLFNNEEGDSTPLGNLRGRAQFGELDPGKAIDPAARFIRRVGSWDARLREQGREDVVAKFVKKVYRQVLRPLDEPEDTEAIGPSLGRIKWGYHCLRGRAWARRDFWMLVVLDRCD